MKPAVLNSDSRRRALIAGATAAGATLLPGCQFGQFGQYVQEQLGFTVEGGNTTIPTAANFAFPSGAQLYLLPRGSVTFHCYVAPDAGVGATSYVLEFKDQLFIYDTQLTPAFGRELRYYANTLNKRFARIIVSHEHAEQWSGWSEFSELPTYASRETETFFANVAPKMPPRPGVLVPKLAGLLAHGDETVSGVRTQTRLIRDAEASSITTLGFFDQKTFLAGDLIYNKLHPFLGHNQIPRWIAALDEPPSWTRGVDCTILPGHGVPTNGLVFHEMRRYLQAAQAAFAKYKTAEEIEGALRAQYPNYGGSYLLRLGIQTALQRR